MCLHRCWGTLVHRAHCPRGVRSSLGRWVGCALGRLAAAQLLWLRHGLLVTPGGAWAVGCGGPGGLSSMLGPHLVAHPVPGSKPSYQLQKLRFFLGST